MSATPQDIDTFLQAHSEWSRITDGTIAKIMRRYKFRNFKSALAFANLVGDISEEANHHPDILVSWGRAEITWWTFNCCVMVLSISVSDAAEKRDHSLSKFSFKVL